MENRMSIDEIRKFCVDGLEILNWYYENVNGYNKKEYDKYITKRQNSNEFLMKVQYAFSFSFKAFMVAVGQGHFVDFETYKDFKKKKLNNSKHNFLAEYSIYVMELGNKMPQAIKNTIELIKKDEVSLFKFYKIIIENMNCLDVTKPFIKGILECNANLPFSKEDWQRYFEMTENVVTKDVGDFNFNTRFRNLFSQHINKMNHNNTTSLKMR